MKKPVWLNKKINFSDCSKLKKILRGFEVHTVCEESMCPNISECFSLGIAAFIILGETCTRNCSFCAINKGQPQMVDEKEAVRLKEAVKCLGLDYIVITSPTRDDLEDGGLGMFLAAVDSIKSLGSGKKVEVLVPDFLGKEDLISKLSTSNADVIAHNLETVPTLYPYVRNGSDYKRSLKLLEKVKLLNNKIYTKSGIMLGLGEKEEQIINVMKDLINVGCDFFTLGQYLQPSLNHYPVKKYVKPEEFILFKQIALELGFKKVKTGAYVRSSYKAADFLINET